MATSSAGPSIFFQQSKATQDEFQLIELVTGREKCVRKLDSAIREVKEGRKGKDDPIMILKILKGLNDVRKATIELLFAIAKWQQTFTKPIRPQIMECDYIIERILNHIDFVNSSHVRKLFYFQFLRGNALLLPFPKNDLSSTIKSGGKIDSIEQLVIAVSSQEIADELTKFMSPDENTIIRCYQIFINCLPDEVYSKVLVPLDRWLIHPWDPHIKLVSLPYNGIYPSAAYRELEDASLEAEQAETKKVVGKKALQSNDESSLHDRVKQKKDKSSAHSLTPRSTDIADSIASNHSFNIRRSKMDNNPLAIMTSNINDELAISGDEDKSAAERTSASGKSSPIREDPKLKRSATSFTSIKNHSSHHKKGTLTRASALNVISMRKKPLRKSASATNVDIMAGQATRDDFNITDDNDSSDTPALSLDEAAAAELQELDQLCQKMQSSLRTNFPPQRDRGDRAAPLGPRPNKSQRLLFLSPPPSNSNGNNNDDNVSPGKEMMAPNTPHTIGTDALSYSSTTTTEDASYTQLSLAQEPPIFSSTFAASAPVAVPVPTSNHIPVSKAGSKPSQLLHRDAVQGVSSAAVFSVKEVLQEEDRNSLASSLSGKDSNKGSLQLRGDLSVASIHPPAPPVREAGSDRGGDGMVEDEAPIEPEKPKRYILNVSTAQLRAQWFQEEKQQKKHHTMQ